jgi:hypothetical protein
MPVNLSLAKHYLKGKQVLLELDVFINKLTAARALFKRVVAFLELVNEAVLPYTAFDAHVEVCG